MESLKHECGVAMIRLLKPLEYYQSKYGTWMYGINKLYLMMEKQHNRGQEGAGLAAVKLNVEPGSEYMFRERAEGSNAIQQIFATVHKEFNGLTPEQIADVKYVHDNVAFAGELYMGHLRYSTTGKSGISYVHPFLRRNNWRAKNLSLCGNFNMTNMDEVFGQLTRQGQHPRIYSDSYIMLELMGHRLDREVERNFALAKEQGLVDNEVTEFIDNNVDMSNVLATSMCHFDGGYVVCGITGSGEMFAMRDPWGIRPAYFHLDEEVMALASERPVLQTTFDLDMTEVVELNPGEAILVNRAGKVSRKQIIEPKGDCKCSFERIYFSRGSDADIYKERKKLGEQLMQPILRAVDYDHRHTVFSYIPNTAEVAYYGMLTGFKNYINQQKVERLLAIDGMPTREELTSLLDEYVRSEKIAWKDIKLRTFISEGSTRNDLASHVYDVTYGSVEPGVDNLVVIDDSIVRGTTLKESILKILDRLKPKKIVIVSSAPQIRYPDYYGIDMSRLEEFCVFRAAIQLLLDEGRHSVIKDVYEACRNELQKPNEQMRNHVRRIYEPFTVDELNHKIVEMLRPEGMTTPVELVFQSIEGLHTAIPNHKGDWYFTGNYPTPGGTRQCLQAFVSYYERYHAVLMQ